MPDAPRSQPVPMPGPMANRSDLAPGQPVRVPTGVPYGQAKQLEQAQQAVPLPALGGGPPPSAPQGGSQQPVPVQQPMPDARGMLSILAHPTQRPNEPVTTLPPANTAPADRVGNLLGQMAGDPNSTSDIKYLLSAAAAGKV